MNANGAEIRRTRDHASLGSSDSRAPKSAPPIQFSTRTLLNLMVLVAVISTSIHLEVDLLPKVIFVSAFLIVSSLSIGVFARVPYGVFMALFVGFFLALVWYVIIQWIAAAARILLT